MPSGNNPADDPSTSSFEHLIADGFARLVVDWDTILNVGLERINAILAV